MKINEKLNFVVPLYDSEERITGYVHATPISYEIFEANVWIIGKTYAAIYDGGLNHTAGPRVASLVMKDVARQMVGPDRDPEATYGPLMAEIRRMMMAIMPGATGWDTIPYDTAISRGMIDREDATEVESAIVFFTVDSFMLPRSVRRDLMAGAAQLWGAQLSLRNPTEFAESLRTSTETENTGPRAAS